VRLVGHRIADQRCISRLRAGLESFTPPLWADEHELFLGRVESDLVRREEASHVVGGGDPERRAGHRRQPRAPEERSKFFIGPSCAASRCTCHRPVWFGVPGLAVQVGGTGGGEILDPVPVLEGASG